MGSDKSAWGLVNEREEKKMNGRTFSKVVLCRGANFLAAPCVFDLILGSVSTLNNFGTFRRFWALLGMIVLACFQRQST